MPGLGSSPPPVPRESDHRLLDPLGVMEGAQQLPRRERRSCSQSAMASLDERRWVWRAPAPIECPAQLDNTVIGLLSHRATVIAAVSVET